MTKQLGRCPPHKRQAAMVEAQRRDEFENAVTIMEQKDHPSGFDSEARQRKMAEALREGPAKCDATVLCDDPYCGSCALLRLFEYVEEDGVNWTKAGNA